MKLSEVLQSNSLTCAIPYNDIEEMLQMVSDTAKDGKERAIAFCGDDNQLSFPSAVGEEEGGVDIPECPPDKRQIGTFHTHPLDPYLPTEKSLLDWHEDMDSGTYVSCVGVPAVVGSVSQRIFLQRTILCHTFQKQHPEYEDLRKKLREAALEADLLEGELAEEMMAQHRVPMAQRARYLKYTAKVNDLIKEGKKKGIIVNCIPLSFADELSVPDLGTTLLEDTPPEPLYSITAREVSETAPVPVPLPRIKTEEVVFAGSAFTRHTNLDTGEIKIERVC